MNLVIYGFEIMDEGIIDICVEMVSSNKFKFVYIDNGKGIFLEICKWIFDFFVIMKCG